MNMSSVNGKKLTPSEQALWNTLCDNRGKAVTRGQLLAVVVKEVEVIRAVALAQEIYAAF